MVCCCLTKRRLCAGHSSANDLARRPSQLSLHSDGSIDLDNGGGPPSASADLLRRSQDLRSSQNSLPSVDVEREVGDHCPRRLARSIACVQMGFIGRCTQGISLRSSICDHALVKSDVHCDVKVEQCLLQ